MSAYIVDKKTIDLSVAACTAAIGNGNMPIRPTQRWPLVAQHIEGANGFTYGYNDEPDQANRTALGRALWQLNIDAVMQRYPGDTGNLPGPIPTPKAGSYRAGAHPAPTGTSPGGFDYAKALACLLYQCAEGDVPQRPLYQALVELSGVLAVGILQRLPQYEDARGW